VEKLLFFLLLSDSPRKKTTPKSSKKIITYAIIGIVAVAAVYVAMFSRGAPEISGPGTNTQNDEAMQQRFEEQFCGTQTAPNSNTYVAEVALPAECEMPVGIAIDGAKVWYVSTKRGLLGSYDTAAGTFNEYEIPSWPTRSLPFTSVPSWSMSWTVKIDGRGENIWFTDQNNTIWRFNQSTEDFDMFKVPAKYPSMMDFDSNGNLYFIGINSQSLFFGNVSRIQNGTSEGFAEISLPLEGFSGVSSDLVTSGGLVVDKERSDVWVSLLAFQQKKGQLFQYDIETNKVVRIVDLPTDLGAPVGMELDNYGNVWVADHGTSTFFRYDPSMDNITRFVTSIASPKIYGGSTPPNAYTLPYWIDKGGDGSLWFNEHTGNKIGRFDPEELALVEYWIPSQNRAWALCPPEATVCGIANAMQFAVDPENHLWFTEWTENKIAKLDASKQVPIAVVTPAEVALARGGSTEIKVTVVASSDFSGQMIASGTFMPNAALGNSTGIFSEESVSLSSGSSKEISYTFTAAQDLKQGQYTIMLGAGNDDVSYMKAVRVNII
jgi:virginiamycin B lyase